MLGDAMPEDYLGTLSKPWARRVNDDIGQLVRQSALNKQGTENSLGAMNGTLNALSNQVASIAQAQAQSAAAFAAATSALAGQVAAQAGSNGSSGFVLGTSYAGLTTVAFTVPAGYTQALISAQGVVNSLSNRATSESLFSRIVIAGAVGFPTTTYFYPPNSGASSPCFYSLLVGSLGGGSVVTVSLQGALGTASGVSTLSNCTLNAQAIYFK